MVIQDVAAYFKQFVGDDLDLQRRIDANLIVQLLREGHTVSYQDVGWHDTVDYIWIDYTIENHDTVDTHFPGSPLFKAYQEALYPLNAVEWGDEVQNGWRVVLSEVKP